MKNRKVKRRHAWSSIEVNFTIHEFVIGDHSHPESDEIYRMVDRMARRLREAGHVAATTDVLHDIDEEEKEHALGLHHCIWASSDVQRITHSGCEELFCYSSTAIVAWYEK
ncbi:putative pentatricopeptide repeat-containing protein At3g49142 [Magnolia sinica]|uniref:putative pentatricopeptide repeat-containing protein At3g49142 n=1 Tax=Magnolia sinica TaxID=86752 RepID=UPI0026585297|nr:putative pentatricopeptide repeat-containing protein At3g49142 [Magnolia sinica]